MLASFSMKRENQVLIRLSDKEADQLDHYVDEYNQEHVGVTEIGRGVAARAILLQGLQRIETEKRGKAAG